MLFTTMEAGGEGCKASLSTAHASHPVINDWPLKGVTLIVVLFVKCSVVFHLQIILW